MATNWPAILTGHLDLKDIQFWPCQDGIECLLREDDSASLRKDSVDTVDRNIQRMPRMQPTIMHRQLWCPFAI